MRLNPLDSELNFLRLGNDDGLWTGKRNSVRQYHPIRRQCITTAKLQFQHLGEVNELKNSIEHRQDLHWNHQLRLTDHLVAAASIDPSETDQLELDLRAANDLPDQQPVCLGCRLLWKQIPLELLTARQ